MFENTSFDALLIVAVAAAGFTYVLGVAVFMVRYLRRRNSPAFRSYRVSVLGPPGSGKTTAMICLLDQAVRLEDRGLVRLRGESTISRLEEGISRLGRGLFPPPTPEDSSLIYRFDYKLSSSPTTEILLTALGAAYHYRVELADFAGEHTEVFFSRSKPLSREQVPDNFSIDADQNFLKWISESDRCALFIDVEAYIQDAEFATNITTKYMAFWQRYLDIHAEALKERAGTPVVIVFSKTDALLSDQDKTRPISDEWLASATQKLQGDFRTLHSFMERNSRRVDVVAISAVVRDQGGERLGVHRFLKSILPSAPSTHVADRH